MAMDGFQPIIGEPDPKCPDCHGTGRIVLFISSKECDCKNRVARYLKDNHHCEYNFRYITIPELLRIYGID